MIEKFLLLVVIVGLIGVGLFFALGFKSQSGQAPGLAQGALQQCPDSPNCVCSEYKNTTYHIEPISVATEKFEYVTETARNIVTEMGGELKILEGDYLAFTFTSKIFRYVDDFEIRLDRDNNTLHLRSASRVGYSDMGVNRKRVEQFRSAFEKNI